VDVAAGRLIASEIGDGDCLQIGIGGMPNAVCSLLLESGVRDLGVHTEMMIDDSLSSTEPRHLDQQHHPDRSAVVLTRVDRRWRRTKWRRPG
jgi:acyl-CoA hydrolase